MEKEVFSFKSVEVAKKTEDVLEKYKDLLEGPFTEALLNDKIAEFAAKMYKEIAPEDKDIIIAFVNMVCAIHRFTQVGE